MTRSDIISRTSTNREAIQHLVAALDNAAANEKANSGTRSSYCHTATMYGIQYAILELVLCDIPDIAEDEIKILHTPNIQ